MWIEACTVRSNSLLFVSLSLISSGTGSAYFCSIKGKGDDKVMFSFVVIAGTNMGVKQDI